MEANEAMKAMARRIVAQFVTCPAHVLEGKGDDWPEVKSALAAIMETQTSFVEFLRAEAEGHAQPTRNDIHRIARTVGAGEHYALAGDRHG